MANQRTLSIDLIGKTVNVGDVVSLDGYDYTVVNIVRLDTAQFPNSAKQNIGGTAYFKRGTRGQNIYAAALNLQGTIKNGIIFNTGSKF